MSNTLWEQCRREATEALLMTRDENIEAFYNLYTENCEGFNEDTFSKDEVESIKRAMGDYYDTCGYLPLVASMTGHIVMFGLGMQRKTIAHLKETTHLLEEQARLVEDKTCLIEELEQAAEMLLEAGLIELEEVILN